MYCSSTWYSVQPFGCQNTMPGASSWCGTGPALADLAVIALFSFFDALDVRRQLLFVGPGGAVNALQLLVLGIATPVGAGQLGQLEGFQETGVRHVRTAAHVDVFFVVVQAHGLFVRHVLDQAQLVVFAASLEHFDHFGARVTFLMTS
jgi:hypothetical protein